MGESKADLDPVLRAKLASTGYRMTLVHGVETARAAARRLIPPEDALPQMRIEDRVIGFGAVTDIPVRVYWPPPAEEQRPPVVLFCHGGGWTVGDLDTHDAAARAHAAGAEAIIVAVGYRRAPEHRYPAAVEDCWAALQWLGAHAGDLGGDPGRIAVAGDSAGGNLAAVLTQLARDNSGPRLAFQLLWYPSVTADLSLPSFAERACAPVLDTDAVAAFWACYHPEADLDNPGALPPMLVPANADSLVGLPPAYIGTAEHDPLRDDGARYAALLASAGVAVQSDVARGLTHDYLSFALDVPAAAAARDRGLAALKEALHT